MVASALWMNRRTLLTAALGLTASAAARRSSLAGTAALARLGENSLDRLIGAMIVIGFEGSNPASHGAQAVVEWFRNAAVGGVIFFEDNLPSAEAATELTRVFREAAGQATVFLCVDQEGGAVTRLRLDRGFEPLPAAQSIATTSPQNATRLYDRSAGELRRLGFNVNFGPVVDLASNGSNPVIAGLGRSYGADPATVVEYAKAFVEAHRRNHILTALKHFPGHGSTSVDSHHSLPNITSSWRKEELQPFAELTNGGYADMVMIGHLVHADLTEPGRPASLSTRAVQGLLRGKLGYDGVVVSDDMQMGALRRFFSPDESILLGIDAGVDLFIYSNREHRDPEMPGRFHRVVRTAIESGRLAVSRIEESARRIAALKRSIEFANIGHLGRSN